MTTPSPTENPTPATAAMLEDLRRLVEIESPSSDPAALARSAAAVAELFTTRAGGEASIDDGGVVTWDAGVPGRPVLILGHHDTVWPLGTLERLPFSSDEGRVRGPGCFDMKAGLVIAAHALAVLRERGQLPAVRVLVTADEETGSVTSRSVIETEARACGRVLVGEPCGAGGAVKTERKGVALGRVRVTGRASHSGLAPEEGINAAVALGPLLPRIAALSDAAAGTSVVPTMVRAGTAVNTVPALAEVDIDVRFRDPAEVARVRAGLEALVAEGGASVAAELPENRPALTAAASGPLLAALHEAAAEVGQELDTVAVGGASDGNLAAAVGAAVLDGLGPLGDGPHADHEHVMIAGLEPRMRLWAALLPRVAAVEVG